MIGLMAAPPPLWSEDFLTSQLTEQPEYQAILDEPDEFDQFVTTLRDLLASMSGVHTADEALTIQLAIEPALQALGWPQTLPARQLTSHDQVDLTLFESDAARESSLTASEREQVLQSAGIVECKAWDGKFDARGTGVRPGETAAQQIQRYLLIAGTDSDEGVRWGILTNGGRWRIYSYRARPRERAWEIDLARLLVPDDLFARVLGEDALHELRVGYLLLKRSSWIAGEGERDCLLDRLLAAGRRDDEQVASSLSEVVFNSVYPRLVELLWNKRPEATADEVARAALTFLYRLLFLYYAEDRGMLDTEDERYQPYSLRHGVRDQIAGHYNAASFSTVSTRFWAHLRTLTQIVDQGDPALGLQAYNGGLFASGHAIVDEIELTDAELAPIIHDLSHTAGGTYISYRSLEVQQLGSIYERLLERAPRRDEEGRVEVTVSPYARKDSGSYYTPQELVDLVVEQTLTPLVEERVEAFRRDPVAANDPAAAILDLTVLDPAMGSGHFLITAIDWLTDRLTSLVNREWKEAPPYVSPIRERLWELQDEHEGLSDDILLQRMVLKRCIYGVDKNEMAVELAKVALWLHTFTGELPLPYLDHRIRAGDSLLGISARTARDYLAEWGPDMLNEAFSRNAAQAVEPARAASDVLDLTLDDIKVSDDLHDDMRTPVERHNGPLGLVAGLRWLSAGMKKRERARFHEPLAAILKGHSGRAISILYRGENREDLTPTTPEYREMRDRANAVVSRENIIHWEIEFPHIMTGEAPGFDAIVSNPPWDRIEQQEREWFAVRDPEIASMEPASRRKAAIEQGIANGDALCVQYDEVRQAARSMRIVCRASGEYPLLSGGRTNLYSLFVERSLSLANPRGTVGLLTPSGIYADHTASAFFRSVSTSGRLAGIYDFENRRTHDPGANTAKWFADVHPQFKFCALIAGGTERGFEKTHCGFFLRGKADLEEGSERVFTLSPQDFSHINPNTGTAPVVRNRQDAELITRIYRTHPVLVERSSGDERKLWPIRFVQGLFNMTTDSGSFRTMDQLEAAGAYRTAPNRYKRGDREWAPLYQGRMIHHYDHRANAVDFNPDNVNNPYFSVPVRDEQHANPSFFPQTQYWVPRSEVEDQFPERLGWAIGFRDIARSTDERTMIATIVPWAGFGNKVPLLLPDGTLAAPDAACLTANLSSLTLDYVAKRKVQGTSMNWYIVEQLPMIAPAAFDRTFGDTTARDLVRDHVLRLCYTANDLQPFARELGHDGEPFPWDPAERRQLRARLDALFFHLYGLDYNDTTYVLDQFPVLEKNEQREHGRYLTKELVLGQYRALEAGDTSAVISVA